MQFRSLILSVLSAEQPFYAVASLHKSSLGHHHHPLSCNPGFRFDQFYLLLTVFFCSDVSSRTRSRSRQADSSTNMSLPDPRPVVAPRRRRQPAWQPGPALHLLNLTLSPAMEIFFLLGIVQTTFGTWTCLDLDRYPPSNLWNQSKSQIICWRAMHQTICDIWIR